MDRRPPSAFAILEVAKEAFTRSGANSSLAIILVLTMHDLGASD